MKNLQYLVILIFIFSGSARAGDEINAVEIFTQLKSLVGVWEKEGSTNSNFNISFELTANDTTLIETWNNKGKKHSLTLYHLNGANLMATHYCPQGNQPRLHLSKSSTLGNISFEYLDSTNLKNLDDSHQHSLGFGISKSTNKVHRRETYLSKSGEDVSELILVRRHSTKTPFPLMLPHPETVK